MSCHFFVVIFKKNLIHFFEQISNLAHFFTKCAILTEKRSEVCTPVQISAREKNESIKKIRSTLSLTESMMIMMMTPRSSVSLHYSFLNSLFTFIKFILHLRTSIASVIIAKSVKLLFP